MKTILITGATAGIGLETARTLARSGHRIILHGRNDSKTQKIVQSIREESGNNAIDYLIADLYEPASIRAMVQRFYTRYTSLDVLINNAGAVLEKTREINSVGLEKTVMLNTIAPYMLAQLLMPALEASGDGRIINYSSASYKVAARGAIGSRDFNFSAPMGAQSRYSRSKLFAIWLTLEQARELEERGSIVKSYVVHPGAVMTNFGQQGSKGFLVDAVYKSAAYLSRIMEKYAPSCVPTVADGAAPALAIVLADSAEDYRAGGFYGPAGEEEIPARFMENADRQALMDWLKSLAI